MKSRLDNWKKPKAILTSFTGQHTNRLIKYLKRLRVETNDEIVSPDFTTLGIVEACKEIIVEFIEEKPIFHFISYAFDTDSGMIQILPLMQTVPDELKTKEDVEEYMRDFLALASGGNVPVYPNTEKDSEKLLKYHRLMLIKGFSAPDGKGERVKLKLVRSPGEEVDKFDYLKKVDVWDHLSPADIAILQSLALNEYNKLKSTEAIINNLKFGISELENLISLHQRNENKIQKCLERFPILFGTEYINLIPKHYLGSEYEMDYALEKLNGLYDLVEIESSNLSLFTKQGNPTKYLVHAEQQILDWLDWVEKNISYAKSKLPNLLSPLGYVVIGLRKNMSKEQEDKLHRRNITFQGKLQVLTYDDLLNKAKNLLNILYGNIGNKIV